jgi:hypothetical protein
MSNLSSIRFLCYNFTSVATSEQSSFNPTIPNKARFLRELYGFSCSNIQWRWSNKKYIALTLKFLSSASSYTILLGAHNRNSPESHEQRIRAKKVIVHPQYGQPALNNDIALIQLERPATLTSRVSTVCLPSHNFDVPLNSECYITGKLWWWWWYQC